MRLYISGGISIDPNGYKAKFQAAEDALRAAGYDVVNPARNPVIPGWTWLDYMRVDIAQIAQNCDGIALLHDWEQSPGARVERTLCEGLGLPVGDLEDWVGPAA